jgi:hypothetical protein
MEDALETLFGLFIVVAVAVIFVGARRERARVRYAAEVEKRIRRDQVEHDLWQRVMAAREAKAP